MTQEGCQNQIQEFIEQIMYKNSHYNEFKEYFMLTKIKL